MKTNNARMCSHMDMQSHPGSNLNPILTFDLLTLGSMHAECLPRTMCLLVLIAQNVFF